MTDCPNIVFHGTTQDWSSLCLQADGTYRQPSGEMIFFDSELNNPVNRAKSHSIEKNVDAILLLVDTSKVDIRRPPGYGEPGFEYRSHYWVVDTLPPKSYITYNLTKDPLRLFEGGVERQIERMETLCRPLGLVPDYATALRERLRRNQAESE